jgi:GT2 family glycosyltransferase
VVILNYNGRKLLGRFLPLIAKTDYAPLELVVVDNASSDDSCGWLRARWPQVTLLRQEENRAYAGGNNVGIRYALEKGHRYIVIANNDIEPHPSWVREGVAHATAHPQHGCIGFNVFNHEVTRPAFEEACRRLGRTNWKPVAHISGCSLLCNAELFRSIGLFDETYRFYAEENDLEIRATRAGWQMVELTVPVWHLGEGSTRKMGLRRAYLSMRNLIRMHLKLDGAWRGLWTVGTVFNRACNPSLRLDFEADYTLRRYRPSSLPVNAGLALAALGWNTLALPHTLYAGWRDRRRVAEYLARQIH